VKNSDPDELIIKPSLHPIIQYTSGSYFGDAELISHNTGKIEENVRQMTAIG